MRKYFKKDTVIYRFKLEVLGKNLDLNDETKHELWDIYLYGMMVNKFISPHQAKTWTYPTKQLK